MSNKHQEGLRVSRASESSPVEKLRFPHARYAAGGTSQTAVKPIWTLDVKAVRSKP